MDNVKSITNLQTFDHLAITVEIDKTPIKLFYTAIVKNRKFILRI